MRICEELQTLASRLGAFYGEEMALTVTGSLALDGFVPMRSDINLLLYLPKAAEETAVSFPKEAALLHDVRLVVYTQRDGVPVFLGGRGYTGSHDWSLLDDAEKETEPFTMPQDTQLLLSAFSAMVGGGVQAEPGRQTPAASAEKARSVPASAVPYTGETDRLLCAAALPLHIAQARFSGWSLKGELPQPVSSCAVRDALLFLLNRSGSLADRVLFALAALAFLEEGLFLSKKGAGVYGIGKTPDPMEKLLLTNLVNSSQSIRAEHGGDQSAEAEQASPFAAQLLARVTERVHASAETQESTACG